MNSQRVKAVQGNMPEEAVFQNLAQTFKALADTSRVKMIYALLVGEFCVGDLAQAVGLSVSATSHHLGLLRSMRLVKYRKDGKLVYYSLDDEHVERLFHEGLEHLKE